MYRKKQSLSIGRYKGMPSINSSVRSRPTVMMTSPRVFVMNPASQ